MERKWKLLMTILLRRNLKFSYSKNIFSLLSETKGLLYVSGKLPTYPFPKPTLTLASHLEQNLGSGEG